MAKCRKTKGVDLRKHKSSCDYVKVKKDLCVKTKGEKLFASEEPVSEDELRGGIVAGVQILDSGVQFCIVQLLCSNTSHATTVYVPKDVISTCSICRWGKMGFETFNPYEEDCTCVLGESVKFMGSDCVTLNLNNLARRIQMLCAVLGGLNEYDKQFVDCNIVKNLIIKFVFKVIEAKSLSSRDREFLLNKVQELFSCDVKYFTNNFADLDVIIKNRIDEHNKNNRTYTQKRSYINVYE